MLQSLGPAPGIEAHAPHQIMIEETDVRWQVRIGDLILADSRSALVLNETNYSAAVYFPIADVQLSKLQAADIRTNCPFKGEASYFRLASEPRGDVVAWTYPTTYDDLAEIQGYVAFYADRVTLSTNSQSN